MTQLLRERTDLSAALQDQGYRVTSSRRGVIGLLERAREGLSAEEVCLELPGVGRATVYRTLRLLLNTGAICKLVLPDGAPRYTLARVEHHHHTICVKCGAVGEFRHATIERLLRAIGDDIPGELVGHRIEAYIVCQKCLADSSA